MAIYKIKFGVYARDSMDTCLITAGSIDEAMVAAKNKLAKAKKLGEASWRILSVKEIGEAE